MKKYEIEFLEISEAWNVLDRMKIILKEYGQVSVADQKELCGQNSTYTDNNYGWKELWNYFIIYDAASKKYILHLNQPEPLGKGCTYDRCTENRYGYHCPHCQSLNIREVSSYHDAGDVYQTIGYQCTNCHTTFTIDVFDVPEDEIDMFYCGGRYGKSMEDTVAAYCKADCLSTQNMILARDKMELESDLEKVKKELEEAQLLTTVLKKEIDDLKWEKTWYEAHYTEAKKNINELQEKLDNATRSYSCVAVNLYKKKKQFKEAMRLLKNAEFFMNSGQGIQDIHSMYPQWVKGYYSTLNNIKEFLIKKED